MCVRALKNLSKSSRTSLSQVSVTFSGTTSKLAAKLIFLCLVCLQSYFQDQNLIEHFFLVK